MASPRASIATNSAQSPAESLNPNGAAVNAQAKRNRFVRQNLANSAVAIGWNIKVWRRIERGQLARIFVHRRNSRRVHIPVQQSPLQFGLDRSDALFSIEIVRFHGIRFRRSRRRRNWESSWRRGFLNRFSRIGGTGAGSPAFPRFVTFVHSLSFWPPGGGTLG